MKVTEKPLTAFEVYSLKKTPTVTAITDKAITKSQAKRMRLKKKMKINKLKEAGVLPTEDTANVVIRSGAVKPTSSKKKLKTKAAVNGVNGIKKKTKKKKKNVPKSVENGTIHDAASEAKVACKSAVGSKKSKTGKGAGTAIRKVTKAKSDDGIDRKADLKKKIAKVKKLVNKKAMEEANDQDDEEVFSDMEEEEAENGDEELTFVVDTYSGEEIGALSSSDSRKQGQETFLWIIKPYTEEEFFSKYWEKEPLHIKRTEKDYYKGLFSTQDFDKILHEQVVMYSKNLDVTSYSDGKRETHNPIGQAHAPVVWDYYNNGCSLRMLNPQTFHPRVWKCLSSLQEYFNNFCGANVYLTPPDTQGFAPHWDDIEAFILQLEGKKRWRVYKPRDDEEVLPTYSSPNLTDDTIGSPILDIVLEPGDLLYFPRGFIHQGHAVPNEHSLHITISAYQKNSWGHYLKQLLPHSISLAMKEDVEFRKGLPRDYLNYMGIMHSDVESDEREAFKKKVCDLVMRMLDNAPLDFIADQRGSSFIHDCLPPYLTKEDRLCSAYGGGERWCPKDKKVINRVELMPDTLIRLIRGNCIRLVADEEGVRIYHCLENSREYHKEDLQFLEIDTVSAPAVESLINTYPSYIAIESLPLVDFEEKMAIARGLWERGLVVTAHPLDAQYDD